MHTTAKPIDAIRTVETPEGIELNLAVAGPVPRILAWTIDLLIRGTILMVIGFFLSLLGSFGVGLLLISVFALEWFYPVLFEVLRNGQTPGKKMFGLAVVLDDGTAVDWSRSFIRNLLRVADFFPAFYGAGFMSMLISRDFKRLGDHAAGTVVIHQHRDVATPVLSPGPIQPPQQQLDVATQAALIEFGLRSTQISSARQRELASIVTPLLQSKAQQADHVSPVESALAVARWSAGQHELS